MNWGGTLIGAACGFLVGRGLIGAVIGALIGYYFDKHSASANPPLHVQQAFFKATFSIMGYIAKADGRVSEAEIAMARHIMGRMELSEEKKREAIAYFNLGKSGDFDFHEALENFRQVCLEDGTTIRMFLEIQFAAAFADGDLDNEERRILLLVSQELGWSRQQFEQMVHLFQVQQRFSQGGPGQGSWQNRSRQQNATSQSQLQDAYELLGVSPATSLSEIKKAYRRLISQNHPDKLAAKGVPEEMMKMATEKTQKITKAYELVSAHLKQS